MSVVKSDNCNSKSLLQGWRKFLLKVCSADGNADKWIRFHLNTFAHVSKFKRICVENCAPFVETFLDSAKIWEQMWFVVNQVQHVVKKEFFSVACDEKSESDFHRFLSSSGFKEVLGELNRRLARCRIHKFYRLWESWKVSLGTLSLVAIRAESLNVNNWVGKLWRANGTKLKKASRNERTQRKDSGWNCSGAAWCGNGAKK